MHKPTSDFRKLFPSSTDEEYTESEEACVIYYVYIPQGYSICGVKCNYEKIIYVQTENNRLLMLSDQ